MKFCPECGSRVVKKQIDGASRFICSSADCNYIAWNNPVPVVAALVKLNDNYILARNSQWPRGLFSLITGYLESGENVEEAVLREVKEELGLEGRLVGFIGHTTFRRKNQLLIAFEVEASGSIQKNHEIAETIELSAQELKSYNFSQLAITEQIIKNWANNI
jgi:NADH pyrophosphatase NudC (nudix superfamily)